MSAMVRWANPSSKRSPNWSSVPAPKTVRIDGSKSKRVSNTRESACQPLQRSLLVEKVEQIALVRLVPGNLVGGDWAEVEALDVGRGEQAAAQALVGNSFDETAIENMVEAVRAVCRPIDDKRGTVAYRIEVAGVLAARACRIAHERARSE